MNSGGSADGYYLKIQKKLSRIKNDKQLFDLVVNLPFKDKLRATNLDLGMIVLVLVDKKAGSIERIAHSNTSPALDAYSASPKPFLELKIPYNDKANIIARAVRNKKFYQTSDWQYLFCPAINASAARFNQAEAGMGCSVVYPLQKTRDGGALIFSFYQPIDVIDDNHHEFMKKYTELASKALNKDQ